MANNANRNNTRGRTTNRQQGGQRTSYYTGNTWTSANYGTGNRNSFASRSLGGNRPAPGYNQVFRCFEQKIDSYRTLAAQTTGTANAKRPTPTTLNSFANWVSKGAVVNRVTTGQICRWTGQTRKFNSPTTVKTALAGRFGNSVIKAVTCDKNGNFLVCTAPTSKGRPFTFPR